MTIQTEIEYEDLTGLWADLESGLGMILNNPESTREFAKRVVQYDRWMQSLLQRDPDVGLYLLFQLACNSPEGYSASHALVCAVLCHLMAQEMGLTSTERDSLVRAAMTMNLGMTALQDELAKQAEKPTTAQQEQIRAHPSKGAVMLAHLGIADSQWLDIVAHHHDGEAVHKSVALPDRLEHLITILQLVDRYAAMISPRVSRSGKSASDSARALLSGGSPSADALAKSLVQIVGLYPPGTYTRMDNDELAVVLRRSYQHNNPYVALIGKPTEERPPLPRLHNTADSPPRIHTALAASAVRTRVNHFHILELGAFASPRKAD
ncbi:MAG: phosphodiesterase [Rhodoferax sp.]